MTTKRKTYLTQAREILRLAWDINGAPNVEDQIEVELRTLNGLLAIALTEFTARPVEEGRSNTLGGAMIGLKNAITETKNNPPHVVDPGPNQALRCSVDGGYLDMEKNRKRLKCEECGRIYSWPNGKHLG